MAQIGYTTNPEDLQPISSATDGIAFAQESKWGDLTKTNLTTQSIDAFGTRTGGDYYGEQPLIVEASIKRAQELIDFMYKTGHAAYTKPVVGPETVADDISFLLSCDGTALFLQNATQDPDPDYRILGARSAMTVNVTVADDGDLTASSIPVANSLSGVSAATALTLTPSSAALTPIQIADDGDLTGTITVLNDLSGVATATAVTVALTGATISGTTATVQIVGTDAGNNAQTTTVTFNSGNLTTAQTTTDVFATITSITPSGFTAGTVDVTAAGQSGTVVITGADAMGATETATQTFTAATLTAAQTTTETFLTVTSIVPSGFNAGTVDIVAGVMVAAGTGVGKVLPAVVNVATALDVTQSGNLTITNNLAQTANPVVNPVKILVTPQTGAAVASGSARAQVIFEGTDHAGNEITEVLRFSGTGVPAAKETTRFFAEITSVSATGWNTGSTVNITVQDKAVEVTFRPQDTELLAFLTCVFNKGTIPYRYGSLIASQFALNVNRSEPMMFAATMMGQRTYPRVDFAGNTGQDANTYDLSMLENASTEIFAGWMVRTEVGGIIAPFVESNLSLNQTLSYSGVQSGVTYETMRPYRSGKRDIMIGGQQIMSKENDLVRAYGNNETFEEVNFIMENTLLGSFGWELRVEMDQCILTADVDPESPTFDRYLQPVTLRAFDNTRGTPADFRIIATYSDYRRVRAYTLS